MSARYLLARLAFGVFRVKTLRRSQRLFAGVPHPSFIERSLFGYRFFPDVARGSVNQLVYLEGARFIPERRILLPLLRPGMRVVDVGANIGYYLLLFQKGLAGTGEVICIEPSPENLPELKRTIEANAFTNVRLLEVALGETAGETKLRAGINSGVTDAQDAAYTVPIRRLDEIVGERVDLLKIDVEGYEGQVLAGARTLLERHRPILFLEFHPAAISGFGRSTRTIFEQLRRLYARVDCYNATEFLDVPRAAKLLARYFGTAAIRRCEASDEFLRQCDEGRIHHTFWAVFRP